MRLTSSRSKSSSLTPSLFDDVELAPAPALLVTDAIGNTSAESEGLDDDEWTEVPQARFLSWSRTMQLDYCWRRDLDAALRTDNQRDAAFFLQRATMYQQERDRCET